jgi:hypothetical protein
MFHGVWMAQIVHVMARLGVADALAAGPRTARALAPELGADPDRLHRLLRAAAGIGLLRLDEEDRFSLTPDGQCLRADVPGSQRAFALFIGEEWTWRSVGALEHTVRTGQPAIEHLYGARVFDYLAAHAESAKTFDAAMTSSTAVDLDPVVKACDFGRFGTLVDVGGGAGSLLIRALGENPSLRGVLFDAPSTADRGRAAIAAAGLADRCQVGGGDFFRAVPDGGDAIALKSVLHDWDDDRALEILRACHRALRPGAHLLVIERLIPPGGAPHPAQFIDLAMMVLLGGRERTSDEFRALLGAGGFTLGRVLPAGPTMSVLEAIRA